MIGDDPFAGIEVCAWCDEITYVGQYQAIGGGAEPVDICGECFKLHGHLYTPWVTLHL